MQKRSLGYIIITSAIIWGVVIVGCAWVLKGTPFKEQITNILIGGVVCHLLFIWAPIENMFKKK